MSDFITFDFLVSPALLIMLCALGAWLTLWNARLGVVLAIVASSLLYLAAVPVVAARLLEDVEIRTQDKPDFTAAQAIVVLGGGIRRGDGDEVPDTLGPWTIERLDFAAHAYRALHLKVAVSGGRGPGTRQTEAGLMKAALEADFHVPVSWVEDRSSTTFQNALYTKQLLQADRVTTVVLVTNAWHMRRALWSFERVGLHAIPWPAPLTYDDSGRPDSYVPSMSALDQSYHALHEAIGLMYYRLRY